MTSKFWGRFGRFFFQTQTGRGYSYLNPSCAFDPPKWGQNPDLDDPTSARAQFFFQQGHIDHCDAEFQL